MMPVQMLRTVQRSTRPILAGGVLPHTGVTAALRATRLPPSTGLSLRSFNSGPKPSTSTSTGTTYGNGQWKTFQTLKNEPRKAIAVAVAVAATGVTLLALHPTLLEGKPNPAVDRQGPPESWFSIPWFAKKDLREIPATQTDARYLGEPKPPQGWKRRYFSDLSEAIDSHDHFDTTHYPVEKAVLTKAPEVPPPITRKHPVRLQVDMTATVKTMPSSLHTKYEYWTFNDIVPGPFIRARVGDVLEVTFTNNDIKGIGHNIDFHAVTGPGGGAPATYAEEGQTRTAAFKLLYPGLWIYHCAAEPVPVHIANGMYGLILVEPEEGLSHADKEFYVMQSEIYGTPSEEDPLTLEFDYNSALEEKPRFVVFNGRVGALTENPLRADAGDRVRLFFGNAGPNLSSAFHVIGTIFDRVHREGDLLGPPGRGIHTTTVGPGAASMIEVDVPVPGNYSLVDHAIFRLDKGAVGFMKVVGDDERRDIYDSRQPQVNCAGCKLHN